MGQIIIAIDGYSSCGKSTLARDIAQFFGYIYIDSGAMYRAVTYSFLESDLNYMDIKAVDHHLKYLKITFGVNPNGKQLTMLNNEDVSSEIRTRKVNEHVSIVAAISAVRSHLVKIQQTYGHSKGIVMDGRDIGTVVFPKAELKLFMTADIKVRTERRYMELKSRGMKVSRETIHQNLQKRDKIDSERQDSPLTKAGDAVLIDNTNLSKKEQFDMISALARCRMNQKSTA